MRILLSAALLLALPATVIGAAPSTSADLTLATAPAKSEFIIDGAVWACSGSTCHAGWVDDMPALRSCQRVVRETGAVTAFTWRGKTLSADELTTCNAKARQ